MPIDCSSTIRASIIDGIAWAPRFRQRSLVSLHRTLENARPEILQAILHDASITQTEALFQHLLTLSAIKSFHATLHPDTFIETEYRIAKSRDHPGQTRPCGYAYINPGKTDGLYTTIVAVAAAFAAGNCVLFQQSFGAARVATIVQKLMTTALSREVFCLVSEDPFEAEFQKMYRVVVHGSPATVSENCLRSIIHSSGRTVAIVDRSADLKAAARDCVHARFAFGGTSAYAPDLVMVNEFCVTDFASAVVEVALHHLAVQASTSAKTGPAAEDSEPQDTALSRLESSGTVLASGDKGRVVLLHERDIALCSQKICSPTLLIVPISSVDDAVDFLSSSNSTMLATYIYASPPFAKYVSQFVRTSLSLVNHLPPELLVGPPASAGFAASIHPRYTPEMFSVASPAFIQQSLNLRDLTAAVWPEAIARRTKKLEELMDTKLTPLKEPFGPAVGFFEQGFLVNAGLILSSAILCCVLSVKYGYPKLMMISDR